jgi:hypothetical protein
LVTNPEITACTQARYVVAADIQHIEDVACYRRLQTSFGSRQIENP